MSDDDIIELTEVVSQGAPAQGQASGPKPDFGADLDALLQEMGGGAKAAPQGQAMPGAMNLGTRPADGHVVNPNEEIDLPSLSDLDALLEELGVDDAHVQKPSSSAPGFDELDGGGEKPRVAAPAANPNAELEAMLDDLQTGGTPQQPRPTPQPQQAPPPPPVNPAAQADLDIESILEDAAAATAPPPPVQQPRPDAPQPVQAQPQPAPAAPAQVQATSVTPSQPQAAPVPTAPASVQPLPVPPQPAPVQPQPVPAAPVQAAPAPPVPSVSPPSDEGIDMNQLDAMLDQVLSGAPKNRTVPAVAPVPDLDVAGLLDEAATKQATALPAEAKPVDVAPADADDDDILDLQLEAATPVSGASMVMEAAPVATVEVSPAAKPAPPAAVPAEPSAAIVVQPAAPAVDVARVEELEKQLARVDELEGQFKTVKAENVELKLLLSALQTDLAEMRANIERYAARAAAKVIREELSSLGTGRD